MHGSFWVFFCCFFSSFGIFVKATKDVSWYMGRTGPKIACDDTPIAKFDRPVMTNMRCHCKPQGLRTQTDLDSIILYVASFKALNLTPRLYEPLFGNHHSSNLTILRGRCFSTQRNTN